MCACVCAELASIATRDEDSLVRYEASNIMARPAVDEAVTHRLHSMKETQMSYRKSMQELSQRTPGTNTTNRRDSGRPAPPILEYQR